MESLQAGEVVNLAVDVLVLVVLLLYFHLTGNPNRHLTIPLLLLVVSHAATIAEAWVSGDWMNFVEHFSLLMSAVMLVVSLRRMGRGGS